MIPGITTKLSEESIASTTTIAPLSDLVLVSGTTAVATITPPPNWGGRSSGIMILVATDAAGFATVTTGNIALAVSLTTGKATVFVWSASQAKWYPGAIS
jgi:hypothetical protein